MPSLFVAAALSGLCVMAQGAQAPPSIASPEVGFVQVNEDICVAINNEDLPAHPALGTRPLHKAPPLLRIPSDRRVNVAAFGVSDVKGNKQTIADHQGKVLVLCFWNTNCQGSLRALKSMKRFQAEEARGDFIVWPIHAEPWPQVQSFFQVRRPEYDGIRVFEVGVGANGRGVLGDRVLASPMIYVIDRKGRIAASYSGYRSQFLPGLLNDCYLESD